MYNAKILQGILQKKNQKEILQNTFTKNISENITGNKYYKTGNNFSMFQRNS